MRQASLEAGREASPTDPELSPQLRSRRGISLDGRRGREESEI